MSETATPTDDSPTRLPAPSTGWVSTAGSPACGDCDEAVVSRPAGAPTATADGS